MAAIEKLFIEIERHAILRAHTGLIAEALAEWRELAHSHRVLVTHHKEDHHDVTAIANRRAAKILGKD